MMHVTPQHTGLAPTATIRALSSLTPRDIAAVKATVRATGALYGVETHDDYDGYLSIILTCADPRAASFLVSGRVGAVELAEIHGDDMIPLGQFASIGPAMLALRPALECASRIDSAGLAAQMQDRHGADADLQAALRADASEEGPWRAVIRAIDARNDN